MDIEVDVEMPGTVIGTRLFIAILFPSAPWLLSPQHCNEPLAIRAQVWMPPAET